MFVVCLRHDREGRQGRLETQDRVRTSGNHLTDVCRKWSGPFLSEDMIELELSGVSTALNTGQQREESHKKEKSDSQPHSYTLNMQYTFLVLIASIILSIYGCRK